MGSKKRRKKDSSSQASRPVRVRKKDMLEVEVRAEPSISVTGKKLWLFRIIAITVIPVLLFILLEAGLRLAGFGYPTTVAIRYKDKNIDSYYSNIKFSWLFFNPRIARTIDPFMFPVKKSADTYRIFVMGASAAAGTPDGAYSFGRMLEVMLRRQYPGTNFEVITAAMPAINSHAILEIAKDCTDYDPDLYVVYLGNNEVVGPYGAGTVFAPLSDNLSLIRFRIALKSWRVGQLLTSLTDRMNSDSPQLWTGMKMFLHKQVRKDDPQMDVVYKNYRRNLTDILKVAQKNKIPLVCCTVGSNLKDSPPFASLHKLDLAASDKEQWDQLYQQGISLENEGEYSSAVDIYMKAAEIDPDYADLQFRLGRCYWEMSDFEKCKERYILARELDTLRFRADAQINSIIRDVAGDKSGEGIYLVDAYKVFEDNSLHGITGQELFHEHVHLKFKGNYILAQAIFNQIQDILPEKIKNNSSTANSDNIVERSFPSQEEVERYLAYTAWEKHRITKKVLDDYLIHPPFTNQLYQDERINQEEQKIKVLKAALTEDVLDDVQKENVWAIQQSPSDPWLYWNYGHLLEGLGKLPGAALQYEQIIKLEPTHHDAYAKLGLCYGFMDRTDEAIKCNLKAIKLYPYYAVVYFNLGLAYHLQEKYDKAIANYKKAISLNPQQPDAYYNYALLYYNQGKVQQALDIFHEGLKIVPDDLNLHFSLGVILNNQGQKDAAIEEFREVLRLDPNHADAQQALESLTDWNRNAGSGFGGWN